MAGGKKRILDIGDDQVLDAKAVGITFSNGFSMRFAFEPLVMDPSAPVEQGMHLAGGPEAPGSKLVWSKTSQP